MTPTEWINRHDLGDPGSPRVAHLSSAAAERLALDCEERARALLAAAQGAAERAIAADRDPDSSSYLEAWRAWTRIAEHLRERAAHARRRTHA